VESPGLWVTRNPSFSKTASIGRFSAVVRATMRFRRQWRATSPAAHAVGIDRHPDEGDPLRVEEPVQAMNVHVRDAG